MGRATASSHCGLVARGHVCPERSSARSWVLPTSHSLEPQSLPHLVIQWSRCFSPKLVTQHMACHSLEGKELERFAWDVCNAGLLETCPAHPALILLCLCHLILFPSTFFLHLVQLAKVAAFVAQLQPGWDSLASLLSQPKFGWCDYTPCLSPALMLQVRQHQTQTAFLPSVLFFLFPLLGICHRGGRGRHFGHQKQALYSGISSAWQWAHLQ